MLRGLLLCCVLLLGLAGPAHARDGITARSDHFVLRSDAAVAAHDILSDLEIFRHAVLADLELAPSEAAPLSITITDDLALFDAITPGGITAAIYLQSAAGSDIVVGHSEDPEHLLGDALEPAWLRLVLRHEVVHHIIESHYPRKLPIWLGEGLAEYYATFDADPDGLAVFGRSLPEQDILPSGEGWLPMRTVIESLSRYPNYAVADAPALHRAQRLYYGQVAALARFVIDQPEGLARVHRFTDGLGPDTDSEDSFEAAFGLRYAMLEARMRQSAADGADRLRVRRLAPRAGPSTITVAPLSAGEANTHALRLLLRHGRTTPRAQDAIARARTRPGVDTSALQHAEALQAWRQGDWNRSDRFTDAALARDPADARALKIRAKSAYGRVSADQMNETLWDAAERAALRALAAMPDDPQLHLFRVAVSLPEADGLPREALASLDWLGAREVQDRLPHEAMMMIPALIYEGRLDRADDVLDTAARWTTDPADLFVIERLRANVAAERASGG